MGVVESQWNEQVSASGLKAAKSCLFAWYLNYVEGHRSPPTAAASLGVAIHAMVESYLGDGTMPSALDEGQECFWAVLPHLPTADVTPEHDFAFDYGGVTYRGFIDALTPKEVVDLKTSSNPQKWGLTQESLPWDVQALIYGMEYLRLNPDAQSVRLRWLYVATRGLATAYNVVVDLPAQVLRERFHAQVHVPSKLLVSAHRLGLGRDGYAKNSAACDNFGGCHHRAAGRCDGNRYSDLDSAFAADYANPTTPTLEEPFDMSKSLAQAMLAELTPEAAEYVAGLGDPVSVLMSYLEAGGIPAEMIRAPQVNAPESDVDVPATVAAGEVVPSGEPDPALPPIETTDIKPAKLTPDQRELRDAAIVAMALQGYGTPVAAIDTESINAQVAQIDFKSSGKLSKVQREIAVGLIKDMIRRRGLAPALQEAPAIIAYAASITA